MDQLQYASPAESGIGGFDDPEGDVDGSENSIDEEDEETDDADINEEDVHEESDLEVGV